MNQEEREKTESSLYGTGLCLLGGMGIFLAGIRYLLPDSFRFFQMPCMFYTVFDLYCPGCGGTRAVRALVQGRFLLSFLYHPIVLYGAAVFGWFMISHTIQRVSRGKYPVGMRLRSVWFWTALGIAVINTAVKDIALTAAHVDLLKLLDQIAAMG